MRRALEAIGLAALLLTRATEVGAAPRASRPMATSPAAPAAPRQETVLEVLVLHGTHEARETDRRIGDMPELKQGPFANYSSYQLLTRSRMKLTKGGQHELRLPNGRLLQTRLEDVLADGSSRVVARINRAKGSEFLPLLEVKARPGQAFIVAGQSYKRGVLVLVFKVVR
jgi:hypothetical protein